MFVDVRTARSFSSICDIPVLLEQQQPSPYKDSRYWGALSQSLYILLYNGTYNKGDGNDVDDGDGSDNEML